MMFINKPRNRILLCIVIVLFATMSTTGWPLPGLSGTPLTMVRGGKDNCRGDILFRANGKSVCATQPGTRVLADTDFSTGVETDILSGLLNSTRWGGPGSQRQPRSGDTSKSRHENPLVVTLGTQANWLTYVTAEFSYLFGLMQRLYGWHGLGLPIQVLHLFQITIFQEAVYCCYSKLLQSWEGLMSDLRRVLDGELPDILIFIEEYPGLAALGPKPASLSCYTQMLATALLLRLYSYKIIKADGCLVTTFMLTQSSNITTRRLPTQWQMSVCTLTPTCFRCSSPR
jgi:hypothetical protein